jgi:hypothetical protein
MKAAFLAFAVLCGPVSAQHVSVAPEVTSIATVGRWHGKSATGSFRVVVVRDGWEHVWSRVYVEWLQDPVDRESPTRGPVNVQELIPPGIAQGTAVLQATARSSKPGALEIIVRATSNMEAGTKSQVFVYEAASPGVTRLIRGARAP